MMAMDRPRTRGPVLLGTVVGLLFFGGLGGWSMLAPLASAAVAAGEVMVEGNRRTMQHLEGGIVREILAHDGDRVEAGQVLLRLDPTQAQATLRLHAGRLDSLRAQEARLAAERDGTPAVAFPADLGRRAADEPELRAVLDSQRRIFATRAATLDSRRKILAQRVRQLQTSIDGLNAQLSAVRRQRELILMEREDAGFLEDRGLIQRSRVLALERETAALDGRIGEIVSGIASAEQAIGETRLAIAEQDETRLDEVARELAETQAAIAEADQRARAAADVLRRLDVAAPVSGRVVDMQVFTVGGVIAPGADLLSIVPDGERLWATVRINPTDVDAVRPGQAAQVMLAAYSSREIPPLPGALVTVSADRLVDEVTGQPYFLARIELDEEPLKRLDGVSLSPGMPVQAMIATGEQTMFAYLTAPLRASLARALRED